MPGWDTDTFCYDILSSGVYDHRYLRLIGTIKDAYDYFGIEYDGGRYKRILESHKIFDANKVTQSANKVTHSANKVTQSAKRDKEQSC